MSQKCSNHNGTSQQKKGNAFVHLVQDVLAQHVKNDPGQQSGQVIGYDQFYFLEISRQNLKMDKPDIIDCEVLLRVALPINLPAHLE